MGQEGQRYRIVYAIGRLGGVIDIGTEVRNIMEKALSACASSANSGPLRLHERKGRIYETRSQLHVLLVMPFGTHKSTILNQIPGVSLTEFTAPGLLGTITKEGDFIEGSALKSAGKVLKIDEHQKLSFTARDAMLNLLEHQSYDRNIGYAAKKKYNRTRKNILRVRLKEGDNMFSIYSRFSCVCAGMWKKQQNQADDAWLSRFLPLTLNLTRKDIYNIYRGENLFDIKMTNYTRPPEFTKWLKFVDLNERITDDLCSKFRWAKMLDENYQKTGFFGRLMSDIARLTSWHENDKDEVEEIDVFMPFLPLFCYNLATSTLSFNEYQVFSLMMQNKYTAKEIEAKTGLCKATVLNISSKLTSLGLFKGVPEV